MTKFSKFVMPFGILIALLLAFDSVSAFEFLNAKDGVYYYRTDSGRIISKAMPKNRSDLVMIHQERNGKRKYYQTPWGKVVVAEMQGPVLLKQSTASDEDVVREESAGQLSNTPDYEWWYGCAPTSTGMMLGYYDVYGYQGLAYDNLVPGGTAELSTFGTDNYIVNDVIASEAHINDYYCAYGDSGNDPNPGGHADNCLADFMETSKDSANNTDGATTFWYYSDGTPITPSDIEAMGDSYKSKSGMYGIKEWLDYNGYSYDTLYNCYIDAVKSAGITFADFKAEIDGGRTAVLHVNDHTMFAYGYVDPDTVYIHDTWSQGTHTMTWGDSYSGSPHMSMTLLTPSGGRPVSVNSAFPAIMPLLLD